MEDSAKLKWLSVVSLGLIPLVGWLNRQRGKDTDKRFLKLPKLVIYLIIGLIMAPLIAIYSQLLIEWYYFLGTPLIVAIGLWIQLSPSWGECFPSWLNNTSKEDFAAGVRGITNKWAGFQYMPDTPIEEAVKWRTKAMSVRWGLYSIPFGVILCVLFGSLIPLGLIYPVVMLLAGPVYAYFHLKQKDKGIQYDAVEPSEYVMGAIMGAVLAAVTIGYAFFGHILTI